MRGEWLMVLYCTREDVKSALDVRETARANARIDQAIESVSRQIEGPGALNRVFYPEILTRTFDRPDYGNRVYSWRLDLEGRELISMTTMTSGGITIVDADRFLRPDDGPPYNRVEIDLASAAMFTANSGTWQRSISGLGLWGWRDDRVTAGAVVTSINASVTTLDVTASPNIGVGTILVIGTERLLVTERGWLSTAQTASLAANATAVAVAVSDGTAFIPGELIAIDTERMLVEDVIGNTLTVRRAVDGSVLAVHTTALVYVQRHLTVIRGALGTTAAAHTNGDAIAAWACPGPVRALAKAEAIVMLQQESSAYARTVGQAESEREASGRGLADLRKSVRRSHGRRKFYGGGI